MIEVTQADRNLAHDIYEGLELYQEAGAASQGLFDNGALIRQIAAHRQQAEDAMREWCAVIADNHRQARIGAAKDAHGRKAKPEARDHESMAIEALHIATAIRATQARPAEQRG